MKKTKVPRTTAFRKVGYEGESIENKVARVVSNESPIEDTAPMLYTERKDGVIAGYNIRTDRWDVALQAMEQVNNARDKQIARNIAKKDGNFGGKDGEDMVENATKSTVAENPNLN